MRLDQLHASPLEANRVHALLFLCGLKYLLSYRQATRRRLCHYLDDGLRDAVEQTLPVLMRACCAAQTIRPVGGRGVAVENTHFERLAVGFACLPPRLPTATTRWVETASGGNRIRLSFGMGVAARFDPDAHAFVREMLGQPPVFSRAVLDVIESFHWHPDWSLALAR